MPHPPGAGSWPFPSGLPMSPDSLLLVLDLLHSGGLDADLLAQQLDLLLQAIPLGLPSELRVQALRSPALRQCEGGPGKGDDLDYRRADTTGPGSGQWKRTEL